MQREKRALCPVCMGALLCLVGAMFPQAECAILAVDATHPTDNQVVLEVSLSAGEADTVSGGQFDLVYDPTRFALQSVISGSVAQAAGKDVIFHQVAENQLRVMVVGLNQETMQDGALVSLVFSHNNRGDAPIQPSVEGVVLSNPFGEPVQASVQSPEANAAGIDRWKSESTQDADNTTTSGSLLEEPAVRDVLEAFAARMDALPWDNAADLEHTSADPPRSVVAFLQSGAEGSLAPSGLRTASRADMVFAPGATPGIVPQGAAIDHAADSGVMPGSKAASSLPVLPSAEWTKPSAVSPVSLAQGGGVQPERRPAGQRIWGVVDPRVVGAAWTCGSVAAFGALLLAMRMIFFK